MHVRLMPSAFIQALLVFVSSNLCAEDYDSVVVRAVGALPSAQVVAFVAQNSKARELDAIEHPEAANMSAEQLAGQLCGLVQDGYMEELRRANSSRDITENVALGSLAYVLAWPGCLRVGGPLKYRVRKGDSLTSIRLLLTEEYASGPGLKTYFANSGIKTDQVFSYGTTLNLPFETIRTVLQVPKAKRAMFEEELKAIGGREIFIKLDPVKIGRITPGANLNLIQGGNNTCLSDGSPDYPFSANAVMEAIEWLKDRKVGLNTATIAVADNGFFGVPCKTDNCPEMDGESLKSSARFPAEMFASSASYSGEKDWVGPRILGGNLRPVNYGAKFNSIGSINEYSGHGTHVAGLVVGGPGFQTISASRGYMPRESLKIAGDYKLKLTIFSLAQGTEELDLGAEEFLYSYMARINGPAVVNLSIVFDTYMGGSVAQTFSTILRQAGDQVVFVAAAGNQDVPLDDGRLLPASLGGPTRDNVITVASADADGKLSEFSNRGSQRVDIAAPGCHIPSWLDATSEEVPLSGTSQSAAIVSFATGVLSAFKSNSKARLLKNRLLISGDLLSDEESRAGVASMSALNIAKALYFTQDYITINSAGGPQTYLGDVSTFSGVSCNGKEIGFANVRSMKRLDSTSLIVFRGVFEAQVTACKGGLKNTFGSVENKIHFEPKWQKVGEKFEALPPTQEALDVPAAQVLELIRKDPQ